MSTVIVIIIAIAATGVLLMQWLIPLGLPPLGVEETRNGFDWRHEAEQWGWRSATDGRDLNAMGYDVS